MIREQTAEHELAWWLHALDEAPATAELPFAAPPGGGELQHARTSLPAGDVDSLGVALAGVLARYSSTGRVTVTVRAGGEWLPVPIDLADDPDADTASARWAHACTASRAHVVPLADLAASPAGPAVAQVALCLDDTRWPLPEPPVLRVGVTPSAGQLALSVRAASGTAAATSIAHHLSAVATHWRAGAPLSTVPMLSPDEVAALHRHASGERIDLPAETVWDLVARAAARTPEAPALADTSGTLDYAALVSRVDALATRLHALGLGPGDLVGLCVPRSADMVVGLLAILRAGCAYVPIDPEYPAGRIAMMVEDAALKVVVTQRDVQGHGGLNGLTPVPVDAGSGTDDVSTHGPLPAPPADGLAYVIFTSGSTGRPKGVMIGHPALLNFVLSIGVRPGLSAADRLLAVTTLSFDIAALELLVPLTVGASVFVADPDTVIDPPAIAERLDSGAITVMQATPATWRMLIDSGWPGRPGLRVLCGGEAMPAALAASLGGRCAQLWNMYGPTETTIWSLTGRIGPDDPITLGTPIANTELYVAGRSQELVPAGVSGELLIGGSGLARGYLGRPDLTDERFVPDEIGGVPGARLYRTGDLVRRRADGRIEFVGRMDNQVKVRGFRIECGEVETALDAMDEVARSVAVVRPNERTGANQLLAYVVLRAGVATDPRVLRRRLGTVLPEYMVPSAVVSLETLPLTLNGKVDRAALPAPEQRSIRPDTVPGRTPTEARLVEVWESALGITPIGVHDDVFELGADSLTTARLFAEVGRAFGLRLPIATVFEAPTVGKLAVVLDRMSSASRPAGGPAALVPIRAGGTTRPLFLVHGGAGTVVLFEPLARRLGDDVPVFALQAVGLLGDRGPQGSVRRMARTYVREMRAVQSSGPYRIGGYCYGALVAFEMARLLKAAGERTELLISFNGPSPSYITTYRPRFDGDGAVTVPVRAPGSGFGTLVQVGREDPRALPRAAKRLLGRARWQARRRARRWRRDMSLVSHVVLRLPLPDARRETFAFQRLSELAQQRYRPPRAATAMMVVAAAGLYRRDDLGWREHTSGPVETVQVTGPQMTPRQTMTDAFVAPVVEAIRQRLVELDRG